jgi:hypothetical protein
LWIPTSLYKAILSRGVVPRGVKSSSFTIPDDHWDGCVSIPGQISIQAAYVCPEWTWIFVDHNVMLTFHVMALRRVCTKDDLRPGSDVCTSFLPSSFFFSKLKTLLFSFGVLYGVQVMGRV